MNLLGPQVRLCILSNSSRFADPHEIPQRVNRAVLVSDGVHPIRSAISARQREPKISFDMQFGRQVTASLSIGPLIAGLGQACFLSVPGSWSFSRSWPHDAVRVGCLNVRSAVLGAAAD